MKMHLMAAGLLALVAASVVWAQTSPAPATAPATSAATGTAPAEGAFKSDKERMGYALGLQLGGRLNGVEIDYAAIAEGIKDSATDIKPRLSEKEIDESLMKLQQLVMSSAEKQATAEADKNQKAGDAFLAENGKKDGVKTTASGLEYKVIKSGNGKSPKATDTVSVNYRGTLISGKEFDASDGKPVSFPVNRVIPGWTEALQLMKEGDKWELYIPAKLAYGERGAGPDIGPNSVLVFEVELLEVK
jgi:FKBP-type peptidyl-prolyl cis-trans isomerase FklB